VTSYDQIARDLFEANLTPEGARTCALHNFNHDSAACEHKWLLWHEEVKQAAELLLEPARRVVRNQCYEPCLKAGFFAALYSPHMHGLVTRIEGTRPAHGAMPCQFDRTCLRLASNVDGDRYDNCPSVHAAQWLDVPQGFDTASLLWMETGAVLVDHGYEHCRYVLADSQGPYRCSMCLKSMSGKGIVDVCRVTEMDGKPSLHFAPVQATLGCLLVLNLANMLDEKLPT